MTEPKTLETYLAPLKADVAKGEVQMIPARIMALQAVDDSFPREAAKRLARIVFTKYPGFVALGSGVAHWPDDERKAFAAKIRDTASDAHRLEGAIAQALASAEAAVEASTQPG